MDFVAGDSAHFEGVGALGDGGPDGGVGLLILAHFGGRDGCVWLGGVGRRHAVQPADNGVAMAPAGRGFAGLGALAAHVLAAAPEHPRHGQGGEEDQAQHDAEHRAHPAGDAASGVLGAGGGDGIVVCLRRVGEPLLRRLACVVVAEDAGERAVSPRLRGQRGDVGCATLAAASSK